MSDIVLLEYHFDHGVFRCTDCGTTWTVREGTEHRHACKNDTSWLDEGEDDEWLN